MTKNWINFRFLHICPVEKCEISPNLAKFHISPHLLCGKTEIPLHVEKFHVLKSEISPHGRFFLHGHCPWCPWQIWSMMQVCIVFCMGQSNMTFGKAILCNGWTLENSKLLLTSVSCVLGSVSCARTWLSSVSSAVECITPGGQFLNTSFWQPLPTLGNTQCGQYTVECTVCAKLYHVVFAQLVISKHSLLHSHPKFFEDCILLQIYSKK